MAPDESVAAAAVYARSLVESLTWLRPEQQLPEASHRDFFRDVVAEHCAVWVEVRHNRIAGVLAMRDDEIDRLYVDPPDQGQGVGAALLDHAKALSPEQLLLVTRQGNTGARRFYERHGFTAFDYGTSPPPESEPDVWYRWRPEPASTSAQH